MLKYFDPDSDPSLTEPVKLMMPVDEPHSEQNEPPQVWYPCITKNQSYEEVYFKLFQAFRENEKK